MDTTSVRPKKITKDYFFKATGDKSAQDDLQRSNCKKVGEPGHFSCGWCFCKGLGHPKFYGCPK